MSGKFREFLLFIISVAICQLTGVIGSIFTMMSVKTWYQELVKPSLTPPGWVFSPVWISLFFLMGVSLYLIWRRGFEERGVKVAFIVFIVHLGFNILWSALFFGMRSPFLALLEIIVLWAFIVVSTYLFFRVSKVAGVLLLPYLLWVSFAVYLNFSIWRLNM